MQRNYIALALAVALMSVSVAGCATNPTTGQPSVDTTKITDVISEVQKDAATICGFVPTLGTIASVIATFAGGAAVAGIATQVANAICTAVIPAKAAVMATGKRSITKRAFGASTPMVNGVPIQGYFLR